ncbi:MAG: NTP transferase domain-containing protein [Planctomycetota bacterium]|jgi:NDP-sugar pyrophosphorylase family protein|nr:NTP transferase domain-containing protein [Planctomycetota bacterium]
MPAIAILAGGLATRLKPVSEKIPKSLLPVAGEPFIQRQLRLLREKGIGRAVICAGHLGEMIRREVGDGGKLGLAVEYSFDGERLLGTAGALRRAAPLLGESFLVLYGDSYLDCDYASVWRAFLAGGKPALMTLYRNEDRLDASNAVFADGEILAYDKKNRLPAMRHIDYGLGALSAAVLSRVEEGAFADLADLYRELLADGLLAGLEVRERFYEIGSFAGLEELSARLARRGRGAT